MLETMKRILTMAGKYRHKVTIGIIISLLHSFFSAMDLFAILYISFSINTLTQQKIGVAAAILLVGLTGKIICKYQITEHISGSSYDVFYEKRLEAGEKLKRVPMGYFSEKNLGEIQMAMTTDMNALESSAMSVVENILGSLIYAAVCTFFTLLMTKVPKQGAALILAIITGLLYFATGECTWVIIVTFAVAGILGEAARKVLGYKSFKGIALAGGFTAFGFIGSPLPMWLFQDAYMKSIEEMGMGVEYVEGLQSMISAGSFIGMLAVAFVGGLIGTLVGRLMLKKHFEKAGIV